MRTLGSMVAETYASWLLSITQCCPALASASDEKPHPSHDRPIIVLRDQPALVPRPSAERLWPSDQALERERAVARKRSASRGSHFSVRRRFLSNASSRRPQISAPTNFRHVNSESFQFPPIPPQRRPRSGGAFRPLELSIYMPENQLSPILPHFDYDVPGIAPPPAAYHATSTWDDSSATLTHERSYSSMSFHLPRRQLPEEWSVHGVHDASPPRIPPRARARAYTSPSVERIVERIASAMIEKELLQSEIDSVIERQSIYISSRPSTAYGMEDFEPMPSVPALPAAAPSFAERLSTESRPQTAPSQPIHIPRREKSFAEASASFNAPIRQERDDLDRPLAPPLPLVLRPPLRKKKSFSRVSSWLFPGAEQQQGSSVGTVTNLPKPVTGRDGFYQCVASPDVTSRMSSDSDDSTVSSWGTEEEGQTVPTTWSPGSSRFMKQDTPEAQTPNIDRKGTFGRGAIERRPTSVGVAF